MKKWIIIIIVLLILIGAGWVMFQGSSGGEVSDFSTAQAEHRKISKTAVVTGSIEPNQEVEIKSPVSGILDEVYVSVGDIVERGQRVARIQIVPDPEQVNQAETALQVARVNHRRVSENFNRKKELYEADVISKAEFEDAQTEYEIQQRELRSAENRLEIIRQGATREMEETSNIITATMDGVVMSIPARSGGSIQGRGSFSEGTNIMTIADMDRMVFQGEVGESDVGRLEPGMNMVLTLGAIPGETYNASLGFISPRGQKTEEGMVNYSISALVESKADNLLRAGYSASADIIIEEKEDALSVEERHLKFDEGKPYLEVKTESGEFEKRFIKTGISDGLHIEITEGLEAGEEFKIAETPGRRGR